MTQTTDTPVGPIPQSHPTATRDALLTVAERLFLTEGYDRVSVRAICAAAQANPAAVHYHFGTKDDLTIALLESRLAPLWADPLGAIDATGCSTAQLVDVLVAPFVELQRDPTGHLHLRLLSRFVLTRPTANWSSRWFDLGPFADILTDAIPGLSATEARRRWALAFQLILLRFGGTEPLGKPAVSALAGFVSAGLSAPPHST
ncbi:TetR/AcrR family transcriptional regulator [Gordonia sp. zg691]|uniref:TetR/AcrR family transcriptional regulator n=1 Tax=Gordonia jinghuaiqii TaxID=2758710 RepID=UPI0016627DAD|nr:TetR/AcrR family transcriptional regulator [Gordonia jinghuaiqii]MBD0861621.1 TetR/AcrR family transcriptional regulator [Gordonia jinghuaiqii]